MKSHNFNGPSREEHEELKFTVKILSPKEEWEWLEAFSLKSAGEIEGKGRIGFICKGFLLTSAFLLFMFGGASYFFMYYRMK